MLIKICEFSKNVPLSFDTSPHSKIKLTKNSQTKNYGLHLSEQYVTICMRIAERSWTNLVILYRFSMIWTIKHNQNKSSNPLTHAAWSLENIRFSRDFFCVIIEKHTKKHTDFWTYKNKVWFWKKERENGSKMDYSTLLAERRHLYQNGFFGMSTGITSMGLYQTQSEL